jgi:hypothetical protein
MKINHEGIEVDIRSESSLYITIKGRVYYIENSVAMKGVSAWNEDSCRDQVDWTLYDNEQVELIEGEVV